MAPAARRVLSFVHAFRVRKIQGKVMTPTSPGHLHDLGPRSIHRADITPIPLDRFYVVTCVSNPVRYRSRYNLYRKFAKHVAESGAKLVTVEMAFGERPFEVTEAGNPFHVQLRSATELWHKENMLNIGVSRIPDPHWRYVAWVDADVDFVRPDWAQETVHQLQHFAFVQMFSMALDIGPHPSLDVIGTNVGLAYCYLNQHAMEDIPPLLVDGKLNPNRFHSAGSRGAHQPKMIDDVYSRRGGDSRRIHWHPGYAWGARREAFDAVGGLLDTGILGAGDHHMALALLGRGEEAMPPNVTPGYRKAILDWQARADRHIRRNLGYVPGALTHGFHGSKRKRYYWDRWKILTENTFDPSSDLKRDSQGLWQLVDDGSDRHVRLRDQIRSYMRMRDEDGSEA